MLLQCIRKACTANCANNRFVESNYEKYDAERTSEQEKQTEKFLFEQKKIEEVGGRMDFQPSDAFAFEQSISSHSDKKPADKLTRNQKSAKIQKRASSDKKCSSCGTTSTPVWRWGGEAKEVLLCNACSLRIRRSSTKPQRAKSPNNLTSEKQFPAACSGDIEPPNPPNPSGRMFSEFVPADAEALRYQLLRCVEFHLNLEKARLLGPREVQHCDEECAFPQQMSPYAASSSSSGGNLPMSAPLPPCAERGYTGVPYAIQPEYGLPELPHYVASSFPYAEPGLVRLL